MSASKDLRNIDRYNKWKKDTSTFTKVEELRRILQIDLNKCVFVEETMTDEEQEMAIMEMLINNGLSAEDAEQIARREFKQIKAMLEKLEREPVLKSKEDVLMWINKHKTKSH